MMDKWCDPPCKPCNFSFANEFTNLPDFWIGVDKFMCDGYYVKNVESSRVITVGANMSFAW